MTSSGTANDDVKAIRRLRTEFFAGIAATNLDRRTATMDPGAVIMADPLLTAWGDVLAKQECYAGHAHQV